MTRLHVTVKRTSGIDRSLSLAGEETLAPPAETSAAEGIPGGNVFVSSLAAASSAEQRLAVHRRIVQNVPLLRQIALHRQGQRHCRTFWTIQQWRSRCPWRWSATTSTTSTTSTASTSASAASATTSPTGGVGALHCTFQLLPSDSDCTFKQSLGIATPPLPVLFGGTDPVMNQSCVQRPFEQ